MESLADLGPALIAVAILLCASAFFSGTEVAMFSLRRVDRRQLEKSQRGIDKLVWKLVSTPRRLIATILIGNELVNVSMAAAMASVGGVLFAGRGELSAVFLTTAITLPLVLLFGEITPKTIAIKTSVGWARAAARPLWLFGVLVWPIRIVIRGLVNLLLIPFKVHGSRGAHEREMGEDEFKALVDAGSAEGEILARERRLIHKVFEFGNKRVAEVMMPADQAFLLAYNLPLTRILTEVSTRGFSRVPIYHKSPDNILGILYAKDLVLLGTGLTAPRRLGELLHEPLFVPRNMRLEKLFETFKERKIHMAIVVNEYGKFAGLVTMEDLLEELVGPIRDEKEVRRKRIESAPILPQEESA